jgi:nucleoside-diphosphate-sugar epimerase
VYEPFAQGVEFTEDSVLKPPKENRYATSKLEFEEALLKLPQAQSRLLILRPTVVFGPYCRPWTDNVMAGFMSGDVAYNSMEGLFQPLYVRDLTTFLFKQLTDFSPGVLNIAGSEKIRWLDFFQFFEDIVRSGKLVRYTQEDIELKDPRMIDDMKSVASLLLKDPSFRRLSNPIRRFIPAQLKISLITRMETAAVRNDKDRFVTNNAYCRPFFGQDRLVSMNRFNIKYGDVQFTDMSSTRDILVDYFSYRFTDKIF